MQNANVANPELEEKVMQVYQELKSILRREDIPPSVRANTIQALACIAHVVNDLAL